MTENDLPQILEGCVKKDRKCQKAFYELFYGFAMAICSRYAKNRSEAAAVLNQGFFQVFGNIEKIDTSRPIKPWLAKIMMNVSINHYRANNRIPYAEDIDMVPDIDDNNSTDRELHYNDLLTMVQKLPPAYRMVFNLFAIEGYYHEEIAKLLDIQTGTSKSNLHRARYLLKDMLHKDNLIANKPHA